MAERSESISESDIRRAKEALERLDSTYARQRRYFDDQERVLAENQRDHQHFLDDKRHAMIYQLRLLDGPSEAGEDFFRNLSQLSDESERAYRHIMQQLQQDKEEARLQYRKDRDRLEADIYELRRQYVYEDESDKSDQDPLFRW